MRNPRHSCSSPVLLASVFAGVVLMVSCSQTRETAPATQSQLTTPTTQQVFVTFEGPWAIAPDPKNTNNVLLLAPKTKHHRDLYVTASNHSTLAAGIYDLSFPGQVTPGAGTYHPAILRAKIDPQNAQNALDSKAGRYAIRLPKPEAFLPAHRHRSRASSTYPPDASTENEYATAFSLRYSVASLNGFSLSGAPDTGTFNPLLLQVDIPVIRFSIEPIEDDDVCNAHSRQAFHDLVQLVGLTLYVDYGDNPSTCHDTDPQIPHGSKVSSSLAPRLIRTAAMFTGFPDVQAVEATAGELTLGSLRLLARSSSARNIAQRLGIAVYFFGPSGVDCAGPGVGGG
jgi:hypothetical protein